MRVVYMCVPVMDSPVNLKVGGPNISVKDINFWITYTGDLFIVNKITAKAASYISTCIKTLLLILSTF